MFFCTVFYISFNQPMMLSLPMAPINTRQCPPTLTHDNNMSTNTKPVGSSLKPTGKQMIKYTLCFELTGTTPKSKMIFKNNHMMWLHTISDGFPTNLELLDNHRKCLSSMSINIAEWVSTTKHSQHFLVQEMSKSNKPTKYLIIHCIWSKVPICNLHHLSSAHDILKSGHIHMKLHQ